MARLLEGAEQYEEASSAYSRALEGGWLSPKERRSVSVAREDLEDLLQEQEESGVEADLQNRRL